MRTSDRAWRGPLDPPDSPVDRRFVPTVATVPPAFGGRHQSIGGGTDPMNPKLRLAALVAGLAVVASACAAGASPTPEPGAPTAAPTAAPPAGGGPDMFIAPNDNLGNEVRGNFLVDLTGKIDDVLANTNEVSVSGSQVDGKVYMVPESLKAVAMYYDTAKVPTPPKTTAELLAFVQGGGKVGILSGAYFGWGFYFGFGGKIFNDDGSCAATANSGVADGIKFVADLKAAGALVDADYNKVNDAFKSGKIDIILNGNWTLGDYRTARPAAAVAPVPAGPGGPSSTMVGVDGWYINASSKNQDLAIAVATELVSQASQEIYVDVAGHVPSNTGISIVDPLVKSFSDAINLGVARPQSKEFGNYWGNFGNAWDEVLLKGGDATAAVAKGCTDMDVANGH